MAGVSLKKLSCPNCGAPLAVGTTDELVECKYCHQTIEVQRKAAPRGQPTGQNVVYVPEHQVVHLGWWPLVALFVLLGIAATIAVVAVRAENTISQANEGPARPGGEHLQWSSVGDVHPALITDDGIEDVVGRFRLIEGSEVREFVGAFDGVTRERTWSAGPFASAEELQHLHTAVSGNRVLVSDARAVLHVLELATGKELAAPRTSDRAKRLCGAPTGPARFYVETADEAGVLVDAQGTLTPAPRPDFCPGRPLTAGQTGCERLPWFGGPELPCLPLAHTPPVKGMNVEWALGDEHDAVLLGVRSPGTAVPMAAGYTPKGKQLRWSRLLPTVDPLSVKEGMLEAVQYGDGTLYAYHEQVKGLGHLVALDVKTGETRWDVEVPNSDQGIAPRKLVLGPERLYVPHWTWLDVFDRETGVLVGTIGRWM